MKRIIETIEKDKSWLQKAEAQYYDAMHELSPRNKLHVKENNFLYKQNMSGTPGCVFHQHRGSFYY